MTQPDIHIACLADPRLAAHATSALPAWLWTTDATRVLWANPVGAAIFGATSAAALATRMFDTGQPAPAQIARLAPSLRYDAPPRLERLRGFGAGVGRPLICLCSRITLDDKNAILVVATEPAGPTLSLGESARRLVAEADRALAVFAADGKLLHATRAAMVPLGGAQSLGALNVAPLATKALRDGHAAGLIGGHSIALTRIGSSESTVLLATITAADQAAQPRVVAPAIEPIKAPPAEPIAAPIEPTSVKRDTIASAEREKAAPAEVAEPPPTPAATPDKTPPGAAPAAERRHPLRFVWQMDADGRFTLGPGEFLDLTNARLAARLGTPWNEIAETFGIDPQAQIARAVATHDTWSGLEVAWPVNGANERLKVELSGLPVFDRDRNFGGYRGFGVCRDIDRIATLRQVRHAPPPAREQPAAPKPEQPTARPEPPALQSGIENVVLFRTPAAAAETRAPGLNSLERSAFSELARKLTARLKTGDPEAAAAHIDALIKSEKETRAAERVGESTSLATAWPAQDEEPADEQTTESATSDRPVLDRLPVGILVYRLDALLYANRAFLDWTGYADLDALDEAGGLDSLFIDNSSASLGDSANQGQTLAISTSRGDTLPVEGRLFRIPWNGDHAMVLMLMPGNSDERFKGAELARRHAEAEAGELRAMLDAAADGAIVLDREGRIIAGNRGAEALFGYGEGALATQDFANLFATESREIALDYLNEFIGEETAAAAGGGREVAGRTRQGRLVPLLLTIGPIDDGARKFCAAFHDITPWKTAERDLIGANREAEKTSLAKSDYLAKISHEMRTPLNAILGFSEVMMAERFGSIGNERYREYLKDIHASGGHVVSLLNDLLDLSKIEAGKFDLNLGGVDLNDLTRQCVAIMQAQANREHIIIRSSLTLSLPQIVADARSVRQIVLNLLSNAIKFTGAGGQVIVSTALGDGSEIVLRVRDSGIGMSEQDIVIALEPFRQLATSPRSGSGAAGLGLPLTKALAEANNASFTITSTPNAGTLVEIGFKPARSQ